MRSTFKSDDGVGWELWLDMKPAPTSSESPNRSGVSEVCCFIKQKEDKVGYSVSDEPKGNRPVRET